MKSKLLIFTFILCLNNYLFSGQHQISDTMSKSEFDQNLKKKIHSKDVIFIEKPLSELPLEMAKADLYIGNDTGIKHLAIALGLPTLSFFGPEPPLEWHPYNEKAHPYFYIDGLDCRTASAHYCPLSQCDSMICLNTITAKSVYNTILSELEISN